MFAFLGQGGGGAPTFPPPQQLQTMFDFFRPPFLHKTLSAHSGPIWRRPLIPPRGAPGHNLSVCFPRGWQGGAGFTQTTTQPGATFASVLLHGPPSHAHPLISRFAVVFSYRSPLGFCFLSRLVAQCWALHFALPPALPPPRTRPPPLM